LEQAPPAVLVPGVVVEDPTAFRIGAELETVPFVLVERRNKAVEEDASGVLAHDAQLRRVGSGVECD
jgi:hypothetical protein